MTSIKPNYSKFTAEDMARMGAVMGVPAKAMLGQAGLLPTPPDNAVILDNACGAGLLTSILFKAIGNSGGVRVVCGDIEEHLIKSTVEMIKENGWNAEATIADAQALPFPDNSFTHNLMNFGIQVIPDTDLVVKGPCSALILLSLSLTPPTESFRVLKPGGKLGVTSSTSPGWLESMTIAVPTFVPPPMFTTGPFATKESITILLTGVGFTNVDVQSISCDHTEDMSRYFGYMKNMFATLLVGEVAEKYEAYMRERYGDGVFTLTSVSFVITAEKL
ncbi:S-adenosyl-L-methionine-dependent methyltransferase [Mycena alexandri]|uniref:S-adenosyl-L-methionine-dependent methyltransferase n=1 Tax=Mycena alexandri TaxID=1745969 RepID=A0AAD6S604_9AGAR|nr:S-adenosyl-L-methionine-dependent methyltransferase [Mycena alexandri]